MRENIGLFRGKRIGTDEWVEGSLHIEWGETISDGHREKDYRILGMRGECYYVDPNTVGECCGGLRDKNGKLIFEGDILRHYNADPYDGVEEKGVVFWDEKFLCFRRTSNGGFHHGKVDTYRLSKECDYEIIGNIHDNPELLKEGADNDNAYPGDLVNEPTIDAVEVVRCQNCIHAEPFDRNCELNSSMYMHCKIGRGEEVNNVWHKYKKYYKDYSVVDRDGFCDQGELLVGERKENE